MDLRSTARRVGGGGGKRCEVSELVVVLLLLRSGTLTAGPRGGGLLVGSGSRTVERRCL